MKAEQHNQNKERFPLLKRIFQMTKPYKKSLSQAVFLTFILAFLSPLRPLLIQHTVDNYIVIPDAKGLLNMTLLMVGLLFFKVLYSTIILL